jgi:hypothetical protein
LTINAAGLFGKYISEREKANPGSASNGFTFFGSHLYADD